MDAAFLWAVFEADHFFIVVNQAFSLDHRDVTAHNVLTGVCDFVSVALVLCLEDFAVLGPWVEGVQRLFEEALLTSLWESNFGSVDLWEILEALWLNSGEGAVGLELAGIDAFSIACYLVSVAIVIVMVNSAVLRPWGHYQV